MVEKEKRILTYLSEGKTREEVAEIEGNTHWKSVDMYMRRRNYVWCSKEKNYIKADDQEVEKSSKTIDENLLRPRTKADRIVQALSREGADLRTIAKEYDFEDYKELAIYMANRGYQWDVKSRNYCFVGVPKTSIKDDPVNQEEESSLTTEDHSIKKTEFSDELKEFLEFLYEEKDTLKHLLKEQTQQLPNYLVKGTRKGKTFQMSIWLSNLVEDYASDYSITQREVIEIALVEFFQRYGYKREVEELLN